MKKIIALLFVLSLLLVSPAFALMCEQSQASGGPDACWTEVTLSNNVTSAILAHGVSAGTVMVYDYASGQLGQSGNSTTLTLAQTGATLVRLATASADNTRVAGILQTSLDSSKIGAGSQVKLLVRGLGDILVNGVTAIASGDPIVVSAIRSSGGAVGGASPSCVIATALEAYSTAAVAKKKAIISVI